MALYLIGDIQGCNAVFQQLLRKIDFSPSRDTLYVLGDMVNRGEDSLGVLQSLMQLGTSAQCLLGNHDIHLLAVAHGIRPKHKSDTLDEILTAPSLGTMLDWLRHQKLAIQTSRWLLIHAGVLPQWSVGQTLRLASEVETVLQSKDYVQCLPHLFGNNPAQWHDDLKGFERQRVIINTLTRLRFCDANGTMDFDTKEGLDSAPNGFMPWFDVPNRRTAFEDVSIAFGHWSRLGLYAKPSLEAPLVLGLDTGCVWGGALTCYDLSSAKLAAISAPKRTNSHAI